MEDTTQFQRSLSSILNSSQSLIDIISVLPDSALSPLCVESAETSMEGEVPEGM